jgi:imidazole glycerol-phosphate synthase subunit HisH
MIILINSGGTNINSILFAIERLGKKAELSSDPEKIYKASHVILPGVGTAQNAMRILESDGISQIIKKLKQPVLGVCLGMQLLFEKSDEGGGTDTLGIVPGTVELMKHKKLSIPHMGWNNVEWTRNYELSRGIPDNSFFYFVHSYKCAANEFTTGICEYGGPITSTVQKDNYFGCQFHPERSGKYGEKFLNNFISL